MKKLLTAFAAFGMMATTGATAMTVVSCGDKDSSVDFASIWNLSGDDAMNKMMELAKKGKDISSDEAAALALLGGLSGPKPDKAMAKSLLEKAKATVDKLDAGAKYKEPRQGIEYSFTNGDYSKSLQKALDAFPA